MKRVLIVIGFFIATPLFGEVLNFESSGNLESTKPLKCVKLDKVSNQNSPADIFIGFSACLKKEKYDEASNLYLAAMSYGLYDTKRVADESAHQAIGVLRINHLGGLGEKEAENLQEALKSNTEDMSKFCKAIKSIGKPEYHPSYMIQHGMGAFIKKSGNGIVEGFDSDKAWDEVLTEYVKCTS